MSKFGFVGLATALAGLLALGALGTPGEAVAGKACAAAKHDTKLVGDACRKGGQAEAKKVMKTFLKTAKSKQANLECKTCHSSLAPSYALKPDGLAKFRELGGK